MFSKGIFLTLGNRAMTGTANELPFPPTAYIYGHDSEYLPEPGKSKLVGPKTHMRLGHGILHVTAAEDSILRLFDDSKNLSAEFLLLARQPREVIFFQGHNAEWRLA